MASPHVAEDLLQPLGKLTRGLFPQFDDDDDVMTFFDALLAKGYEFADAIEPTVDDAKRDAIAEAWAYHQAYDSVWQRLSATPATAKIDGEAERTYLASQIATFETLSNRYLDAFNALVLVDVVLPVASARSVAVPVKFGW